MSDRVKALIPRLPIPPYLTWLAMLVMASLAIPAQAASRTVPDMYRFSVAVADANPQTREVAVRKAMAQVLVRATGDRKVAKNPRAQGLLQQANGYMQRFAYVQQPVAVSEPEPGAAPPVETPPQQQLMLQGSFSATALDAAIRKAGLPLWSAQRPQLLAIITAEVEGDAIVLDREIATAFPELSDTAELRGLPLLLPAQNRLQASDVQDATAPQLVIEAETAEADYLLWGQLSQQAGKWLMEAQLQQAGLPVQEWRLRSREPGPLLREVVHRVGDWLAERHALAAYTPGGESIVGLWVRGVSSGEDYMRVQQHLQTMPGLDQLSLVAMVDGALVFRASAEAGAEQLDRSIRQAGRLRSEPQPVGAVEAPVWTGEYEFHYRLP